MLPVYCFGQHDLSGIVVDKESKAPIPFVQIGIEDTHLATITETNGTFTFPIEPSDKVFITFYALGYDILKLKYGEVRGVIELQPLTIRMDPITFNRKQKFVNTRIENTRRSNGTYFIAPSGPEASGAGIAVQVNPIPPVFRILNASVFIGENNTDTLKVRLRIYEVRSDGLPGNEILQQDFVEARIMKRGWFKVNLSHKEVIVDKDSIFLFFELIEEQDIRLKMSKALEQKVAKIKELHKKGVSGVMYEEYTNDVGKKETRYGISGKTEKKYDLDFPTRTTSFEILKEGDHPTYSRNSAFAEWEKLPIAFSSLRFRLTIEHPE